MAVILETLPSEEAGTYSVGGKASAESTEVAGY